MGDEAHAGRIDKVESEVASVRTDLSGLKTDMVGIKADVRGLSNILQRIETGVNQAQNRFDSREDASRPNMVAVMGVLITIISIIVGGAWVISGQLATTGARLNDQDASMARMISMRDRELDSAQRRLERLEDASHGAKQGG